MRASFCAAIGLFVQVLAATGLLSCSSVDRWPFLSERGGHHIVGSPHSVVVAKSGFSLFPMYIQIADKAETVEEFSSFSYRRVIVSRELPIICLKYGPRAQKILGVCRRLRGNNQAFFGFGSTVLGVFWKGFQGIHQYVPKRSQYYSSWRFSNIRELYPEYILTSKLMSASGRQMRAPFHRRCNKPSTFR